MQIWYLGRGVLTGAAGQRRCVAVYLVKNRLMQRPCWCRYEGRQRWRNSSSSGSRGRRRDEEARGRMERTPGLIYKGKGISNRRENRGVKNRISDTVVASIFGDQLIKRNLYEFFTQMTSWWFIRSTWKCPNQNFSKLKIDMNRFKPIWGLMLGIWLLS